MPNVKSHLVGYSMDPNGYAWSGTYWFGRRRNMKGKIDDMKVFLFKIDPSEISVQCDPKCE